MRKERRRETYSSKRDLAVNRGNQAEERTGSRNGLFFKHEKVWIVCEGTVPMDREAEDAGETVGDARSRWWQGRGNLEWRIHLEKRDCPRWIRSLSVYGRHVRLVGGRQGPSSTVSSS